VSDPDHSAPTWTPPFPRAGGKRAFAPQIADWLDRLGPDLVVLPCAGLGGELAHYTGPASVLVAEADDAIRALWQSASSGCLGAAAHHAIDAWSRRHWDAGRTTTIYRRLRSQRAEDIYRRRGLHFHAAWAIAVGAGAISGIWRRNHRGEFNAPKPPQWTARHIARRVASAGDLAAADRWAQGRVSVSTEGAAVLRRALLERRRGRVVALCVDPPFGSEREHLYTAQWTPTDALILRAWVRELILAGAHVVAWCHPGELDAWRALPSMSWTECTSSRRRVGARTSQAFWMGFTATQTRRRHGRAGRGRAASTSGRQ
jgi:hypothetical protein